MRKSSVCLIVLLSVIGVMTVEQSAAIDVVVLASPADGSECNSRSPVFKWKKYEGTDRYYITFSYYSDLSNPINGRIRVESPSVEYAYPGTLLADRQVYWKVEAIYTHWSWSGVSEELKAISSIGKFRTSPSAPAAPPLISPSSGATNIPKLPTFKWNAASRATSYILYIGTTLKGSNILLPKSFTNVTSPFTPPAGHERLEGKKYYWQVKAIGKCGASTNSTVFSFTTNSGPIVDPVTCTPAEPEQGSEVQVNAVVQDDGNLDQVKLFYSVGGENAFIPKIMDRGLNNNFISSIPASAVTQRGLEIYVWATDLMGGTGQSPIQSVPISIPEPGLSLAWMKSAGRDAERYSLFSIPIILKNNTASVILTDDIGKYDKKKWRLFSLESDSTYKEFHDGLRIEHGSSYMLIVAEGGKKVDTGAGTVVQVSNSHRTLLNQGWNFIGNPFNFSIPVHNIYIDGDTLQPKLLTYSGKWKALSDSLKPFEGFAINAPDSGTYLSINPRIETALKKYQMPSEGWEITITARCHDEEDPYNILGVHPLADEGWDKQDYPEPPAIDDNISLYFPHPEWHKRQANYCCDIRPPINDFQEWELAIQTSYSDKVDLDFSGIENIPSELDIYLIDESTGTVNNLREHMAYSVATHGINRKQLTLWVGSKQALQELLAFDRPIPQNYSLLQNYPNPFNPSTMVVFELPKPETVTVTILNVLGQKVAILVQDKPYNAGRHALVWNARNMNGERIGSGEYFYQLKAGSYQETRKMILLQ